MPEPTMPTPAIHVLIPCGGTGSRAGAGAPKQYRLLAGQPMVVHTLAAFAQVRGIDLLLCVVAPDDGIFETLLPATQLVAKKAGMTRGETVLNGLNYLLTQGARLHDWVLVHDAARCLITPAQITQLLDACRDDPVGGLLALKLPDTLKVEAQGRVRETLDRSDKWLAQTPQMFRIGVLRDALHSAADQVTDEASAVEALGLAPKLVPGAAQNFKVTYPEDFALAEAVLYSRTQQGHA